MDMIKMKVLGCGALGGIMPTMAAVGSTYGANWETPAPALGLYIGLLAFAIIGGVIAIALVDPPHEIRNAVFAGIAAPGIITNAIAGGSEGATGRKRADVWSPVTVALVLIGGSLIDSAGAQEMPAPKPDNRQPAAVSIHPKVHGGVPTGVSLPVFALVKAGDKTQTVPVGRISTLNSPSTFIVPPGTTQVVVSDRPVNLSGDVTNVTMDVKTRPSKFGDFLWALGAPRTYDIQGISLSKGATKDEPPKM